MTGTTGQDWASYQPEQPSTSGLAFVIVKVTEGLNYVNPKHAAQIATGRAKGLVIGHYHFVRPGSVLAQVPYFLAHANPQAGDVLCLDWEDPGVSDDEKDAWIKTCQKTAPGHRVLLYSNRDFWLNRDHTSFAGDGLWIADPNVAPGSPRITAPWLIHQYSEAGGIDRDYTPLTPAQLKSWAHFTEEDDMPLTEAEMDRIADKSAEKVWGYMLKHKQSAPTDAPQIAAGSVLGWLDFERRQDRLASVKAVADAIQAAGGITPEQATAAAEAGAKAALAVLANALNGQAGPQS